MKLKMMWVLLWWLSLAEWWLSGLEVILLWLGLAEWLWLVQLLWWLQKSHMYAHLHRSCLGME
jgi:hypothetical protein